MYQLAETCDLYESINPGVVDPEGNDSEDQYISQIAMMLKYSDKFPNLSLRATKSSSKNGDILLPFILDDRRILDTILKN